jgi:murein DD-endopeptidase MepM/ murein hydrolase activator NlpD
MLSSRAVTSTGRAALLLSLAGLGACSNFDSLRSPIFTGSTNQQQIINPQPVAYAPSQTSGVQGADLPPPAGAYSAPGYAGSPAPSYGAAPSQPQGYTPPQPYAASGLPMPLGQVGASPQPQQLGAAPTTLNEQAARVGGSVTHTVQAGDTAWNISRRYGISVDQLVAANGGSSTVRLGQRITIPGVSAQPNVQVASADPQSLPVPATAAAVPLVRPAAAQTPIAPAPGAFTTQGQQVAMAPATTTPDTATPAPQQDMASASGFRWPVRGRVISEFGKKPNGERNDGINLAVPEGTSVKAAEDGTVIYAGNELKSYGNLVLIRHDDGWVSAYAHNSTLQVKRGDEVRRGQVIALSGMSGGVTTPQLHFELRKDATPVNPLQHLTEN